MGGKPRLSEAEIDKMRQVGIRLDARGRLWHDGAEITHPRLREALLRWMDVLPDGRPILRLDERRYAYLEVEDAHLLALALTWDGERATLRLNDGSDEDLDPDDVWIGAGDAMYTRVRRGKLVARLTTPAYYALTERLVETAAGSFALEIQGHPRPIRSHPPPSPI